MRVAPEARTYAYVHSVEAHRVPVTQFQAVTRDVVFKTAVEHVGAAGIVLVHIATVHPSNAASKPT